MRAALLINLGSPDSPSVPDVRRYLVEFLMDPYVINLPRWLRLILVHGIIAPFRPHRSAKAYAKVWTEQGSPLIVISRRLTEEVAALADIPVRMAMRYGNPSIATVMAEMADSGVDEVFAIPLYPQFAASTRATVMAEVNRVNDALATPMRLVEHPPFFADERYLDVLAEHIRPFLRSGTTKLVFSYHGVPESHIRDADPDGAHRDWAGGPADVDCCPDGVPQPWCYRQQTRFVSNQVAARLGLGPDDYAISYQSRMGPSAWLTPDTAGLLTSLATQGVRRVAVASAAFVADCLETLEELDIRGRAGFLDAGGEEFLRLHCLNDDPRWVGLLADWINEWEAGRAASSR